MINQLDPSIKIDPQDKMQVNEIIRSKQAISKHSKLKMSKNRAKLSIGSLTKLLPLLVLYLSSSITCQSTNQTSTQQNSVVFDDGNPPDSQPQPQPQPAPTVATKPPPILRPSIEEVASELSKKYLNLEHENRRPRQQQQQQQQTTSPLNQQLTQLVTSTTPSRPLESQTSTTNLANEPERDIQIPTTISTRDIQTTGTTTQQHDGRQQISADQIRTDPRPSVSSPDIVSDNFDTSKQQVSSQQQPQPQQVSAQSSSQPVTQANSRRRKSHHSSAYRLLGTHQQATEETELFQCHQYLQSHSSHPLNHQQTVMMSSPSLLSPEALLKLVSDQQLPCSCESRNGIWLSCDYVQLIGSHLFSPNPSLVGLKSPNKSASSSSSSLDDSTELPNQLQLVQLTRFSQRDAGLQVMHSQMFHYMQLYHLKSVDLSQNRIRQIKSDAFHGIELSLEHLDLSHNLLGDSRLTMFNDQKEQQQSASSGKPTFSTDELSRLKHLKWLSLHDNQINQLGVNVFVKLTTNNNNNGPKQDILSELKYLDLSENLLKFVPSDSIKFLDSLETLNLARNRITKLNQLSKFPNSIRYLDLSENLINNIRQCDLIDLTNLIELNLSHNQLSHLDQNAFISSKNSLINSNNQLIHESSSLGENIDTSESLLDKTDDNSMRKVNGDIRLRRSIDATTNQQVNPNGDELESSDDGADPLDTNESESILKAVVSSRLVAKTQSLVSDSHYGGNLFARSQFNSTIRLNLSNNFLENVPGDSLLRFPNLQQLDLSFNRIRRLDSNYLCSIYNLVENLRILDLSGNLLSLPNVQVSLDGSNATSTSTTPTISVQDGGNVRHLNKLFGCLQKLERLLLSANRFGSQSTSQSTVNEDLNQIRDNLESSIGSNLDENGDLSASASGPDEIFSSRGDSQNKLADRLVVKFAESFGSRHLKVLDLSDNQLRYMPLIQVQQTNPILMTTNQSNASQLNQWMSSHRIHLDELNLSLNHIDRLEEHDFEFLYNLRHLQLDYNKISSLPSRLMRRFTNLERLSLNGNRLTSIEPLNDLFERSIRSLRYLNLANNRLLDWPQITRPIIVDTLGSASSSGQEFRQNQQNDEQQTPAAAASLQMFAIEELNLDGNLLSSSNATTLFDQLVHMKQLKTLNLSNNLLNKVKSEWFKFANANLYNLYLTGNKINSIDLGAFAANQVNELRHLHLDSNLLKELKRKTFDSMPSIRTINLANNMIHTINSETFHQINSLQVLKLNNNKLTSWKCEYFSNLCNSLSGNINADITTLLETSTTITNGQQDNQFQQQQPQQQATGNSYVSSLTELDLSYNSLSQLRVNSISVHTKLTKLNLEHNKLSFIPHDLFKATTSGSTLARQIQLASSLKYINLAHNRIQTIDNINFRPLKNLIAINLSFNELQTLGSDVIASMDTKSLQQEQNNRRIVISNNLTDILLEDELFFSNKTQEDYDSDYNHATSYGRQSTSIRAAIQSSGHWPTLSKLRHLNLANNLITMVNQSILSELSPFAQLNLNLSSNFLDSDSLPAGFFTKTSSANPQVVLVGHQLSAQPIINPRPQQDQKQQSNVNNYDLIFTLKLESLDLSHNRLNELPTTLLENHYISMESCQLSHNRIQNLIANSNMMIQIKSLNLEFNPLNRESSELILFEQRNARHLNLAATRIYAIQQASQAAEQLMQANGFTPSQIKHRLANQTSQLDLIRSISSQINAPYLRHLNLSSNQLVWLAANVFDKMHSLQTLDLSNNQLTRLHLLNNQLAHVSPTLEYLNMNANLFTNIDATDFSSLGKLRHLDLSNLLSLQKMNCKFLSKLTSLRSLRMFNYPQLRQNLQTKLSQLQANSPGSGHFNERLDRKLRNELIMSTIGQHCVMVDDNNLAGYGEQSGVNGQETSNKLQQAIGLKWFNLRELELELMGLNLAQLIVTPNESSSFESGFKLTHELSQFLGPQTRKLTLIGLNLTSISDYALVGITSNDLQLKISYTSMSQLPLRQIMQSITKRTRLYLDFRNNNIQTIDMGDLQWLDELQQNNQAFQHGDRSSLRLSNNPFRCDCQTRPLWLWLNQRWDNSDSMSLSSDDQNNGQQFVANGDNSGSNVATLSPLQMKYNSISHTSDMKCYYPQKLRGKLAQHVYYNDLVCKSSPPTPIQGSTGHRQSRKRNETTKSSESHYLSSIYGGDMGDSDDLDEFADDYYIDNNSYDSSTRLDSVKLTKFNRYQPPLANYSLYFINNNIQLPLDEALERNQESSEFAANDDSARHTKRDQHSLGDQSQQSQSVNTKYSKHRPNTHQKHSHFNTLSTLNQLSIGKTTLNGRASGSTKSSFLTESDVMILTLISIAMTIMSFIIITICFFKYKMDQSEKDHILNPHGKMLLSKALLIDNQVSSISSNSSAGKRKPTASGSSGNSSASNSSLDSSLGGKRKASSDFSVGSRARTLHKSNMSRSCRSAAAAIRVIKKQPQQHTSQQVLIPMPGHIGRLHNLGPPTSQNFLMRSPTIRRMHGLATNASDWFKFTLRAYPSSAASRRRRIFLGEHQTIGPNLGSQLTTSQLHPHQLSPEKLMNALPITGCPIHGLKAVKRFEDQARTRSVCIDPNSEQCVYCRRLLSAIQQTKVQYATTKPQVVVGRRNQLLKSANEIPILIQSGKVSSDNGPKDMINKQVPDEIDQAVVIGASANGYISPRVIKALARQLDQEEQGFVAAMGESSTTTTSTNSPAPPPHLWSRYRPHQPQQSRNAELQRFTASGLYRSRDQQVKSMRTFGFNARSSNSNTITSTKTDLQSESDLVVQSQIPTVDVDGRFTYQSESQLDSANNSQRMSPTIPNYRQPNDKFTTKTAANGDIFVYVHDTPTQEGVNDEEGDHPANNPGDDYQLQQMTTHTFQGPAHESRLAHDYHHQAAIHQDDQPTEPAALAKVSRVDGSVATSSSMVTQEDECSRSSSPVAYGFMRSSPSATTVSSNTMTHNQYIVNNTTSPDGFVRSIVKHGNTFDQQHGNNSSHSNNNNNNNNYGREYFVGRKQDTRSFASASASGQQNQLHDNRDDHNSSTTSADEHLIISRL